MSKLTKGLKKTGIIAAKVVGTTALVATGVASAVTETVISVTGVEPLQEIAYFAKSASFNGIRKMWGADPTTFDRVDGNAEREKLLRQQKDAIRIAEKRLDNYERQLEIADKGKKSNPASVQAQRNEVEKKREQLNQRKTLIRRTDEELAKDSSGLDKTARDFQHDENVPLSVAINRAESTSGVYILWLNGAVMKCGRASYDKGAVSGVRWRLRQYYNLKYDDRSRAGEYWSVSEDNRDDIVVSWQCCPISKCHELEYKLFKKYGKGEWAIRAPNSCNDDTWDLLI